jgi:hypothetical protein
VARVPLLLLAARAELSSAQRSAAQAATLLLRPATSLPAMLAVAAASASAAAAAAPTPLPPRPASGWQLHAWLHDDVPYLVDTAAMRVYAAPAETPRDKAAVVLCPLEPVGLLRQHGDVRWLRERACPLDAVAAAGWAPLERAWAQLAHCTPGSPEGTLLPAQLPQLLALLLPGCSAADRVRTLTLTLTLTLTQPYLTLTLSLTLTQAHAHALLSLGGVDPQAGWSLRQLVEAVEDGRLAQAAAVRPAERHSGRGVAAAALASRRSVLRAAFHAAAAGAPTLRY